MKDLNSTGIKPLVLDEIIEIAKKYKVEKVILFGSRARGDHTRASDIDLAVSGGDKTGFTLDVKETTSTLLDFDVVDLNSPVQKELLTCIYKEGIVLYEKI